MISPELLKLLCCPETRQRLHLAPTELIQRLECERAAGELRDRSGRIVTAAIEAGLLRDDGRAFYPVRDGIPVLLVDESIPLAS